MKVGYVRVSTTDQIAKRWSSGQMALKDAIAESNMSESTFFRNCKKYGISKASS